MNLREVIRAGYRQFNRMGEEKRKAHILAIQYIETLANSTNTKMEPWDLIEVFGVGKKGNELVTDKTEINKRFFAKLEEIKTKTLAEVFALEQRISDQIDSLSRANIDKMVSDYTRQREQHISTAQRNMTAASTALASAHKLEMDIMALERRESLVSSQIAKIVQGTFWEFYQLSGPSLDLVTKNDVILTQKNPAAGIDLRVNLGRLKARLDLQKMTITVLKHERNHSVDSGYYHPHVYAGNGDVCWGTAGGTVAQKLPKGEVEDVFTLLATILTTYNDASPYVALARFPKVAVEEEKKQVEAPREAPTPPLPENAVVPPVVARFPETPTLSPIAVRRTPTGEWVRSFDETVLENMAERVQAEIIHWTTRGVDLSSLPNHPTDSTQPALEGCICQICMASRESARLREEFDRLNPIRLTDVEAFMRAEERND